MVRLITFRPMLEISDNSTRDTRDTNKSLSSVQTLSTLGRLAERSDERPRQTSPSHMTLTPHPYTSQPPTPSSTCSTPTSRSRYAYPPPSTKLRVYTIPQKKHVPSHTPPPPRVPQSPKATPLTSGPNEQTHNNPQAPARERRPRGASAALEIAAACMAQIDM